ncbi:hypothetical protein IKQ26_08645 [bacterium]|nr:hypothetical protein [bacterium]
MSENEKKSVIGFWGYPPPELIKKYKKDYPLAVWVDLDIDFGAEDKRILPDSYCKIVKNIINNSFKYKENLITILAPIGKDKCDSGWFASEVLKDLGFPVIPTVFEDIAQKKEIKISTSNLPLRQKFEMITANIVEEQQKPLKQIPPKFGFWGVPPNDLSILELFPDETHVYGWTRCVEAGAPADIELEMFVDKDVPTVFYSQSFCSKSQLAKYLADKYNGLYIDIDDVATNSTRAKIEAFLRLR